ncbi:3-dehydroquinate synthase [Gammaproteobacteria bacterium]|nr:3-dehydroquinate synthase [Gammaproteobacteria bacterium]
MATLIHQLDVALAERSYPIVIGQGFYADAERWATALVGERVLLLSNETIAPLYADAVGKALNYRGFNVVHHQIPDGERFKTIETWSAVMDRMVAERFDRSDAVIALGGGVVGDLGGFVAASYQRGIRFLQMPTTLLAQVDSSVGGKTGVNHPDGKNMIGAFHQPRVVVIDLDAIKTLPEREFNAGMAEVIKYGLIRDADFFAWLEANVDAIRRRDADALANLIHRSCACKAQVVAADEREGASGIRATLNLGHTFGHALESITNYCELLHGEAIAIGMVSALQLSAARGLIDEGVIDRGVDLFEAFELPTRPPRRFDAHRFVGLMANDKKVLGGRIRLILLEALGSAVVVDDVSRDDLAAFLHASGYC